MKIKSPAFEEGGFIPAKYTCTSDDVNPPLLFEDVPRNAKSLALIFDDPDARGWVHWILWNISPDTKSIKENSVPEGAVEGRTTFGTTRYGGPCPPTGTHRYVFTLYALDTVLDLRKSATRAELERAMIGHIIAEAKLIGKYHR